MRLENLLTLIEGELKNKPAISAYENIAYDVKKIRRGDLFFALNTEDIKEAIKKGAYILVYETFITPTDDEIAWIYVEDLQKAIHKLLRFSFLHFNIQPILLKDIQYSIAKRMNADSKIYFDNSSYSKLSKIEPNSFFCSTNKTLLTDLFSEYITLEKMVELKIDEKTLFQTSFFYKEKYFDRILIAPLFLTDFKKILSFFENYDLDYNIQFDKPLKHFQAQFISPSFQAIDFGKTQKVLIYEENKSLFLEAITYLELNTKWAKKIIINPKKWNLNRFFEYDCIDDIIHILHDNNFHFAFIGGIEKELLEKKLLNKNKLEKKFFNPTLDLS